MRRFASAEPYGASTARPSTVLFPPVKLTHCLLLLLSTFGGSFKLWAGPRNRPAEPSSEAQPVRYELDLREPASHLVKVVMTVPEARPETEIQFPAWNGLYQIRDFIRNVQDLRAECGDRQAMVRVPSAAGDPDLNTRRVGSDPCPALRVHYSVYLNGEPPFGSALDQEHGFFNFAMLLFYLPRERNRAVRVKFNLPAGWKLATLLDEAQTPGEYEAANYDALADSPTEVGQFQEYSYPQGGATYRVIVHADPSDYSADRLLKSLERITAAETALMRDVPLSRYTFIFHFPRGTAGGGMEHKYGTAISVRAGQLRTHLESVEGLAAHEFFHLWNVKRIRPQGLEPVDYLRGNDTSDLWFSEGVTSTYGELSLVRAGMKSRPEFYAGLAEEIKALQSRPAHKFQSAAQSGREAWLEKYPDYFRPERSISYYNKGELLGYLLDLGIRHATRNRRSLDDVMRTLNEEFARHGRCFTDADLGTIIASLAPEFTARREFFQSYIDGTAEPDYNGYLGYAGLRLSEIVQETAALGFVALRSFEGPVRVESVEPDSAAERAGLKPGDVILEMNGRPLEDLPQDDLNREKPGKEVKLKLRRGRESLDLKFRLGRRDETVYRVEETANATAEELAVREGWLTGRTE